MGYGRYGLLYSRAIIHHSFHRSVIDTHQFFMANLKPINSMTFGLNKKSLESFTITESYTRLGILIRAKSSTTSSSIYAISISYYFCKNTTIDMIELRQVNSTIHNITEKVNCRSNAVAIGDGKSTEMEATCTPKGNWIFEADQKCECNKGFGLDNSSKCSACHRGDYKAEVSNVKCTKCPDGKTNDTVNTKCQCLKDRYLGEDEKGPCYAVPSKVEGFKITTDGNFVHLSWNRPSYVGDPEQSLKYSVECYHCNHSKCDKEVEDAVFFPGKTNLTTTYVNVSNLTINETYKFTIVAVSRLKNVSSDKWNYTEKNFTFEIPVPLTVPTTATTAIKTDQKAQGCTQINVLTIILSVVASLSILLNIFLLGILLHQRRHRSPKPSTAVSTPVHVHAVESRQNELALHNYEEPYCEEFDVESFKEAPMSARCRRINVDKTRRNDQHKQPLTRVITPDGETKSHEAGTKNDHAPQAKLLVHNAGYLPPVDTKTNKLSQNFQISESSAYAKLDKSLRQDERDAGDYQKLLKRVSDFVKQNDGETNPSQNNQKLEPSTYAKLDKGGQNKENDGDYQKLIKRRLDHNIPK